MWIYGKCSMLQKMRNILWHTYNASCLPVGGAWNSSNPTLSTSIRRILCSKEMKYSNMCTYTRNYIHKVPMNSPYIVGINIPFCHLTCLLQAINFKVKWGISEYINLQKNLAFANTVSRYFYMGEFFSLQTLSSIILIVLCLQNCAQKNNFSPNAEITRFG